MVEINRRFETEFSKVLIKIKQVPAKEEAYGISHDMIQRFRTYYELHKVDKGVMERTCKRLVDEVFSTESFVTEEIILPQDVEYH